MSDPLHGVTLKALLQTLVERHGWEELARRVPIRCFQNEPSIKSSLKFLRRTPWARTKVEAIYVREAREAERKRVRNQRRAERRAFAKQEAEREQRGDLSVPALPADAIEPDLDLDVRVPDYVHLVRGFLAPERCQQLIAWSEAQGYEAATLSDGSTRPQVRNNDRLIFEDPALAERWFTRLRRAFPKDRSSYAVGLNERFRFYRYHPGQRFRHHTDGSYVRENGDFSHFTLLVYLNADFQGGETQFTRASVPPETGAALIFQHRIEHAGAAIIEGTKYVLRTDVMFRRGIRPGAL